MQTEFTRWAKESLIPLSGADCLCEVIGETLATMIGNATVVAIGEGEHLASEPLLFRNSLLRYLVEHKGFTAIAIESGLVEGRMVHDYVRGSNADWAQVVRQGISWGFDQLPENVALVRWLKEYNASSQHRRPINFYGFDVPGSPGFPEASRGIDTALVEALRYLNHVDPTTAATFHSRVDALVPNIRFDRYHPEVPGYHQLSHAERDCLTAAIFDLQVLLEAREAEYSLRSTPEDYAWALRSAVGARQVDAWLRQIPLAWTASDDQFRFLDFAGDLRDRAQAENLEWIIQQEGTSGKILVYAHNGHLSAASVRWNWKRMGASASKEVSGTYQHEVMGTYLRRRLGKRCFIIGNAIGGGEVGVAELRQTLQPPPPDSVDGLARAVKVPAFLLDLRSTPSELFPWLNTERQLGRGFLLSNRFQVSVEVALGKGFDALVYHDFVTPCTR